MQKTLLFFILLCSKLTFAQVIDNFSDGDFTNNPSWLGNASYFQVTNGKLVSNGPQAASTLYLATGSTLASDVAWEFTLNLEFDPSTTNYPRIYLLSNQDDLAAVSGKQAYFLQLGSSTSAENFALIKQTGNTLTTVLTLPDKTRPIASKVGVRVRVERDATGRWDIYTDFSGGSNLTHDGYVVDNTFMSTGYFGFFCKYSTASRYNLYSLSDVRVQSYLDNTAPQVKSVKSLDDFNIQVDFDESVDEISAKVLANYSLSGLGNPSSVTVVTSSSVKLTYPTAIPTANYTLTVKQVADVKGNQMLTPNYVNFLHIQAYQVQRGDVVINEIMAAPAASGTFNKEYIELWNSTDKYIIITGWKYKDASNSTAILPADTLAPKTFRIICAVADAALYKSYGNTLGISPWPALNNDKDNLTLSTADGILIDEVAYQDTWYRDTNKKTGFALELINPNSPCGGAFNWNSSSAANQGSPGEQNSIYNPNYLDMVAPTLVGIEVLSATQVDVYFDKDIPLSRLTDINNYSINNGIGKPQTAIMGVNDASKVTLTFTNPMAANVENRLTISNITNCAGLALASSSVLVILTEPVQPNNLLISEILSNPKTDGYDFVEIYNATNRILDLKGLSISNPMLSGSSASKRLISEKSVYMQPKSFWVLSAKPDMVASQYEIKFPSQMLAVANFPSYNIDSGMVQIWNGDEGLDSIRYTAKMHHPLLKDVKGVSLERVSFLKSGNAIGNMQSAAAVVGFATPTYQNSQTALENSKTGIELASKTFSPDRDGFEDTLLINYQFNQSGNLATLNIYNDKGKLVRRLLKNETLATQGTLNWDGLNDQGALCSVGIYVLKLEVFNLTGYAEKFSKVAVLAAKLN